MKINKKGTTFLEFMIAITLLTILWVTAFFLLWDEKVNNDKNIFPDYIGTNPVVINDTTSGVSNTISIIKNSPNIPGIIIGTWVSVEDYIDSLSLDEICTKWQLGWEQEWSWAYSEKLKWCAYTNKDYTSTLENSKWWIRVYYRDNSLIEQEKKKLFWTGITTKNKN